MAPLSVEIEEDPPLTSRTTGLVTPMMLSDRKETARTMRIVSGRNGCDLLFCPADKFCPSLLAGLIFLDRVHKPVLLTAECSVATVAMQTTNENAESEHPCVLH